MKSLIVDLEGPIANDSHPFTPSNRLSLIGLYDGSNFHAFDIEHGGKPYGEFLVLTQSIIDSCDLIIAFNAKYDLHWLRRYGIKISHKPLWCLQYAEFCMSGQTWAYPSLDDACLKRGIEGKSHYISDTYWSKGVETIHVPWDELIAYNEQDLICEWNLFQAQKRALADQIQLKKLIWYGCQDLLITEDMEFNGMAYDFQLSIDEGDKYVRQINEIDGKLSDVVGNSNVLWSSPQHVSAVLYGGSATYEVEEPYVFVYKDLRTKEKIKKVKKVDNFDRLVEPLHNSDTKKEGTYSTDEGTLRKLKTYGKAKQIVELLLLKRELDKKVGTYFHGIPKLAKEMGWDDNTIHGQLNHCRAASGRLASSKPNQQNLDKGIRKCIKSRFPLVK